MEDLEEAAKAEANAMKTYETCPRDIMNPGIYVGFLEGAAWAGRKRIAEADRSTDEETN